MSKPVWIFTGNNSSLPSGVFALGTRAFSAVAAASSMKKLLNEAMIILLWRCDANQKEGL